MPFTQKKVIVYGEHGPTNLGWEARILTRCRELGMSATGLSKLGLGDASMIYRHTDWSVYFNQKRLNAKNHSSNPEKVIDYECVETQERIKELTMKQQGKCASCGIHHDELDRKPPLGHMCIDHDHSTGEVRALLCGRCNLAEGIFADNPERILKVYNYMTNSSLS